MLHTHSSAMVDTAPAAPSSPAQRAAAGRSTALTLATETVAPVRRRKSSRKRRAEQSRRRQWRRHLQRLWWGGALALALLVGLAAVWWLPGQPPANEPRTWAGAADNTAPATTVPMPPPVPVGTPAALTVTSARAMPTPALIGPTATDESARQRPAGAEATVAAPYGAAAAGAAAGPVGADSGSGTAQLRGAVVSEADLGIRLAPGSQVDPSAASRVREPSGSETVMVVASSTDTADRLAAHYRAQLQSTAGGAAVQSYTPGPGQLLLQSVNPTTGVNRAVLIAPQAPGAVTVTLVRAQPAPGTTGP